MMRYRVEKDVLGRVKVPYDSYYGSETQRALDNFKISGLRVSQKLIVAYAKIKLAAALANMETGKMDRKKGAAIARACKEIINGKFSGQFNLDVFQAGAGTSINMNLNEVIANRAIEILKGRKGNYKIVNPNDDVNMSQSTNDTTPSAIRLAAYSAIESELLPALAHLRKTLASKSREFRNTTKIGRTHLEDAVPMTLGEEFSGYAAELDESISIIRDSSKRLLALPLGGTAVGTGINTSPGYKGAAISELNKMTGFHFRAAGNIFAEMQSRVDELSVADALKETAVTLNKVANDLRLLNSGPRAGIGDIILPAVQPGSSIMPGKINPSIAEMLNMVCFQVIGSCETVTQAADAGQLELNVFMPIIAHNLISSIEILSTGTRTFADKCVKGIKANKQRIDEQLERNLSLATALTPYIGYSRASEIAMIAYRRNMSIRDVCLKMRVLDKKTLNKVLDPKRLAK